MSNNHLEPTSLEKQSLEAHVDLCAYRYANLDRRLTLIERKVETIHNDIIEGQKSVTKVLVGTAGTIIASVLSVVIILIMK